MAAIQNSPVSGFPAPDSPNAAKVQPRTEQPSAANVAKRLQSELMSLMMASPEGISAFPSSDSDLTKWKGRLQGADGTYYAGQTYAISLEFPSTYPFAPPKVRFESTCYHPNVDLHGNICLDILKEKWSPMLSVSTVLISLQSLLGEPNNASPLNVEAAELWEDKAKFAKELAKHYKPLPDDDSDDDE